MIAAGSFSMIRRTVSSRPNSSSFAKRCSCAALGFVVNVLCVGLLWDRELHEQVHGGHHHEHHHADHNVLAAYLHLLTDALTGVLAIIALLSGQFLGLVWMDPLMGIVGALVVSMGVEPLRRTANVLLDATPSVADAVAARWKAMRKVIADPCFAVGGEPPRHSHVRTPASPPAPTYKGVSWPPFRVS